MKEKNAIYKFHFSVNEHDINPWQIIFYIIFDRVNLSVNNKLSASFQTIEDENKIFSYCNTNEYSSFFFLYSM